MSTTCLTTDDLQRFLAGQSPADQEQQVAAHLHDCPRCEALAAQLSDDAGARQYRVTLRDASAAVVWQSAESAEPHVPMDSASLHAGSTYFWTVSIAGAAAPSELGPFMFQIADR